MIDALINQVWANPRLAIALEDLETNWLIENLGLESAGAREISKEDACRYVEAAAILASSERPEQRLVAYRIATYAYELFREDIVGIDNAVRAVLARLGNFPSIGTSPNIDSALPSAPWAIAEEEFARRHANQVMVGGVALALTDFQKQLWGSLVSGRSIAISAPTSTGKSFVLQAFLSEKIVENPYFSACYIVPTRALITQVHMDLSEDLVAAGVSGVEVVTVPLEADEPLPNKAVYVLTQERLQILLRNHPAKAIDFLVIDEAHSVQDGDRGIILQSAIDELLIRNPSMQLLFASPTVSNLSVFGGMTGRADVEPQSTDQVAVSQNFIEVEVTSATRGDIDVFARANGVRRRVGQSSLGQHLASRVECLVHIAHKFGADKQSIVFANGQADAEKLAVQIADLRSSESGESTAALKELAELAKEAVHPKYVLGLTVLNGVGFHYGKIPTILRNAVEKAFADGHLQYLICTSTLLAGVNLPAQNLFLFEPHRKNGVPLESVDFWNLAGRAGRLKREFQGNIYLLNYKKWKVHPLEGPRLAKITPALQDIIHGRPDELEAVIRNTDSSPVSVSDVGLETVFVRLLVDFKLDRISSTLDRAHVLPSSPLRERLEDALRVADEGVTLSADVLNGSPTISAHRQQRLFRIFNDAISLGGEGAARKLILSHPRESGAFESYVAALEVIHGTILKRAGTEKQNRYFALMILRWMQGVSISEMVDSRLNYFRNEKIDGAIRSTLDLVETELRFNYVRAFGCYLSVLGFALDVNKFYELRKSIPSIALYLEIGASDKTMISFVSMGLSRLTAKKLNNICAVKTYGVDEARAWLVRQNLEILGFSAYIRREVEQVLGGTVARG